MSTAFTKSILRWYDKHKRDLPWRRTTNPYHIWLSEVMLQQTQVDTVIPYYHRWLERFPKLEDVALAEQDDVLKMWEGLGYYSRVRNFQDACQEVVNKHQGKVPSNPEHFAKLKGVGPYTLAAVQSIVFGHPLPVVDGNVKRVVSRLLRLSNPPSQEKEKIELCLQKKIDHRRAGDFNQAMMELGATVCRLAHPSCATCPVSRQCEAFHQKDQHEFPKPEPKRFRPHLKVSAGVIWKGNQILISKRRPKGLLGGLWEFPGGKLEKGETLKACLKREIKEELDFQIEVGDLICKVDHAFTHFSIEISCFHSRYLRGKPKPIECEAFKWIKVSELKDFPFPKSNHKIFEHLPSQSPYR